MGWEGKENGIKGKILISDKEDATRRDATRSRCSMAVRLDDEPRAV